MKYFVILGDGMADRPYEGLGGKTPLDVANHPTMDYLASKGICGLAKTVPEGMPPGSDTANLSVMGYDPKVYYTGRSPLEAVSMGIELSLNDVTYRCNTVTLSDDEAYEDCTMIDYSCDEITTPESTQIINDLNEVFKKEDLNIDVYKRQSTLSWRIAPLSSCCWKFCPAVVSHTARNLCTVSTIPTLPSVREAS